MSEEVLFEVVEGHTALITINRPSHGNSINGTARDLMNQCWQEARARTEVRSVVVTGAGQRHFTTGLDLAWNMTRDDPSTNPRWPDIVDLWKPVILAINGVCAGGGNHLVYQSDFAIGSTNATFLEPHVSVGFVPVREALGLATRIPFGAAARMAMTGTSERVDANAALRLGLITELVSPEELLPRTLEVCAGINKQSPAAVRATKQILHKARGLMFDGYGSVQWGDGIREVVHKGPDFIEGQKAFLDRREAHWND